MRRIILATVFAFVAAFTLAACQTDDLGSSQQEIVDCLPMGSYAWAKTIPLPTATPYVPGAVPWTGASSVVITVRVNGQLIAYAADWAANKIRWAVAVPPGKLESFLYDLELAIVPAVPRPVPIPYPPRTDELLDLGFRTFQALRNAEVSVGNQQP